MKYYLSFVMAIIACLVSYGKTYYVTGLVTDSLGEPEPYATIKIYSTADSVNHVAADLSRADGTFSIELPDAGDYNICVSAVGKSTLVARFGISDSSATHDLGKLMLKDSATKLSEITVSAQRPLVSKEIDRIAYDVQADEQSKSSPIIDILKKVPLVLVQPDGTILVNGSSNYRIYRNGRPNASYSQNANELFKSIPASSIKKIEVITDPGAREDAEGVGAILNIVTMENTAMRGVAGSASLSANSVEWYPTQASVFLTTQLGSFTISPYAGVFYSGKRSKRESHSEYTYTETRATLISDNSSQGHMGYSYWGFDSSLEIDTLNLLTFEYSGTSMKNSQESIGDIIMYRRGGELMYSYRSVVDPSKSNGAYQSLSANYQRSTRRRGETITLSYLINFGSNKSNSTTAYYDIVNAPMSYTGIMYDSNTKSVEHTVQLDWSRPYGQHTKLDVGGKYINRYSRSKTDQWYIDAQRSLSDFVQTTSVGALYADWRGTFGFVNLRAGARYEFSRLGGEYKIGDTPKFASEFNDIVPNAAVSCNIDDANTLKLGYSMRISRPGIDIVNPTVVMTPTTVSLGNPRVHSARHHGVNLNYSLTKPKFSLDFSTSYQLSNDGIVSVIAAEDNILYSTYGNVGRTHSLSFNLYIQWMLGEKSSLSLNGSGGYRSYRNPGNEPGVTVSNSGWQEYVYAEFTQRLPWRLRATLDLSYWSGGIGSVYSRYEPVGWYAFDHVISLQRSFLKEDRLTINLTLRNPFGPSTGAFRVYSINSGMDGHSYDKSFYNTSVGLRVIYRFGSLQAFVKKTKSITNDDKQSDASDAVSK